MLSVVGFVAMIIISAIYFSSLGFKKVLIFNGIYLFSGILLLIGVPGWFLLLFHIVLVATYVAVARMSA